MVTGRFRLEEDIIIYICIDAAGDMRLNCELEVVYSLALANGGAPSRSSRARASICLGKKPVPSAKSSSSASSEGTAKKEELFLIVSTAKNVAGNKYKVRKM